MNEDTAVSIDNGAPRMIMRGIRAVHEREAAKIAFNTLKDEGACTPGTAVVISELFSQRERSLTRTVRQWTHRPD